MRRLILIAALALLAGTAFASGNDYTAGKQYRKVSQPQSTNLPAGKIQVTEIFWYHCPHCFHFDPTLRKWVARQPKDVVFRRVPATFGHLWTLDGKVFYAEKALGVMDKMHTVIFNAIHKQNLPMRTEDAYAKLFAQHGISAQKFRSAFSSFGVKSRVERAGQYVRALGVTSVPTLVIDGRYITNVEMAGSYSKMLDVVDFLINKERKREGG